MRPRKPSLFLLKKMKYTITINQLVAVNDFPDLDIIDMAIWDYLYAFFINAETIDDEFGKWHWLSHSKLIEDMPLLQLTSRQAIFKRMNKLIEINVIERHPNSEKLKRSYYKPSVRFHENVIKIKRKPQLTTNVNHGLRDNSIIDNGIINKPERKKQLTFSEDVEKTYKYSIDFFPEDLKPETEHQENKWKDTLRKLIENDKIAPREICQVVKWARSNDFWSGNFLSVLKLRKKNRDQVQYYLVFKNQMLRNGNKSIQQRQEINKAGKIYQSSWDECDKD